MNTLFKGVCHLIGKIRTFGRNSWCIVVPQIILAIVEEPYRELVNQLGHFFPLYGSY